MIGGHSISTSPHPGKAVRARKTRYAAGKYVKPMIAIRKWFGGRMFDRITMSQMR